MLKGVVVCDVILGGGLRAVTTCEAGEGGGRF